MKQGTKQEWRKETEWKNSFFKLPSALSRIQEALRRMFDSRVNGCTCLAF